MLTLTVCFRRARQYGIRLKIAALLIRLAAWVAWMNVEFIVDESETGKMPEQKTKLPFGGCDVYVVGPGLPGFDAEPMTIEEAISLVQERDTERSRKDLVFHLPGDGSVEVK